MSTIDILFWLLVALMGGICWAVESGLGPRHQRLLASSMLGSLGAALFVMFWIDDPTRINLQRMKADKEAGKGGESVEEKGGVDFGKKKSGKKRIRARITDDMAANGKGEEIYEIIDERTNKDEPEPEKKEEEEDTTAVEYSRVPFKDCPTCPDLVIVPGGLAQVGSPAAEPGRSPNEREATTQPMKPFAMGRLEISRKDYEAFVKELNYETLTSCDLGKRRGRFTWAAPGIEQDARHPAVCVSSADVSIYLAWLSQKTRLTYRLPTEAEWEHAARAGTTTPYFVGNSVARRDGNFGRTRDGTTVGGLFRQNKFGISDVIGNAAEIVAECLDDGKQTPEQGCNRIVKGGSWASPPIGVRAAARFVLPDGAALNTVGFRVARDVDETTDRERVLTKEQKKALLEADKAAAAIAAREAEEAEKSREEAAAQREAEYKEAEAKAAKEAKEAEAKKTKAKAAPKK